jgi:hypothetical protein
MKVFDDGGPDRLWSTHSAFRSLDKFSTPSLSAYGRRSQSPTPIAKRHSTDLIGGPS